MITEATYTRDGRTATIRVERIDTWVEDTASIVNFPGILELDGRLILTFARSRHGAEHSHKEDPGRSLESFDDGETWQPAPDDDPLVTYDPLSGHKNDGFGGGCGRLRDGTIVHMSHSTLVHLDYGYDRTKGHMHEQFQQDDPTFRFQRASSDGQLLERFPFKVAGMPWGRRSYQVYSPILEMDDGDLLAAMEWVELLPEERWRREAHGRVWKYLFGVFIVRSGDGGRTWDYVTQFDPGQVKPVYGISDRPVDEGFDEAHMTKLPNGDILCVMRTGSYSPLWQDAVARRRSNLGHARVHGVARSQAAAAGPAERRARVRLGTRVLRPPAGHPRDDQHRRHRASVGSALQLPHRAGMLLHHDHAARRQAARDLLGLRLHTRHGDARAAGAAHSPRRYRHRHRRVSTARPPNLRHWERA